MSVNCGASSNRTWALQSDRRAFGARGCVARTRARSPPTDPVYRPGICSEGIEAPPLPPLPPPHQQPCGRSLRHDMRQSTDTVVLRCAPAVDADDARVRCVTEVVYTVHDSTDDVPCGTIECAAHAVLCCAVLRVHCIALCYTVLVVRSVVTAQCSC